MPTSNPPADSESFTHTTPSKTTNGNGKRPMQPSEGAAVRRGEHLANVRAALEAWHYTTKRTRHTLGSVTAEAVMPGPILTTLASNARIRTLEDMDRVLKPRWIYVRRHGPEVLGLLSGLDEAECSARELVKRAKAEEARKEREAKAEEKKRLQNEERDRKRLEREAAKARIAVQVAEEKARREEERAKERQRKQAVNAAKPRRPRKPVLAGSSIFNVGPSTPLPAVYTQVFLVNSLI